MPSSTVFTLNIERDDDGFSDEIYYLIRDFVQPKSTLTLEATTRYLKDLLPHRDQDSDEVWSFGETCIEIAQQIPYQHPSQLKLVGLLEHLGKSLKFGLVDEGTEVSYSSPLTSLLHILCLRSEKNKPVWYIPFPRLGQSLKEALDGNLHIHWNDLF